MTYRGTDARRAWRAAALSAGLLSLLGCEGGLNLNEQSVGNGDNGVSLALGNIAIDPSGRYFLVRAQGETAQVDVESGRARMLRSLEEPLQLAFSPSGDQLYAVVEPVGTRARLVGYDIPSDRVLFERDVRFELSLYEANAPGLAAIQVTHDGGLVVINSDDRLWVFRSDDGAVVVDTRFDTRIADVDLLVDGEAALVTLMERWNGGAPTTRLMKVSLGEEVEVSLSVDVPNCASELLVGKSERFAYLAPTTCEAPDTRENKDPISVIDLDAGEFVRNLPGFGPVGLAGDGETLVGFMDMRALDRDLFLEGDRIPPADVRYRLMFVDADSLRFDTIALGNVLPRYAITPDGEVVLVDADVWDGDDDTRIRVVDVSARSMRAASGPLVSMQHYAFTSDARAAYLLDSGLYRLDIAEAAVDSVAIRFTPTRLNLTPDDRYLILRESDDVLYTYDLADNAMRHRVELVDDGGHGIEVRVDLDVELRVSRSR